MSAPGESSPAAPGCQRAWSGIRRHHGRWRRPHPEWCRAPSAGSPAVPGNGRATRRKAPAIAPGSRTSLKHQVRPLDGDMRQNRFSRIDGTDAIAVRAQTQRKQAQQIGSSSTTSTCRGRFEQDSEIHRRFSWAPFGTRCVLGMAGCARSPKVHRAFPAADPDDVAHRAIAPRDAVVRRIAHAAGVPAARDKRQKDADSSAPPPAPTIFTGQLGGAPARAGSPAA